MYSLEFFFLVSRAVPSCTLPHEIGVHQHDGSISMLKRGIYVVFSAVGFRPRIYVIIHSHRPAANPGSAVALALELELRHTLSKDYSSGLRIQGPALKTSSGMGCSLHPSFMNQLQKPQYPEI